MLTIVFDPHHQKGTPPARVAAPQLRRQSRRRATAPTDSPEVTAAIGHLRALYAASPRRIEFAAAADFLARLAARYLPAVDGK